MIQFQYMAPWVPTFASALESELAAKDNSPPFTLFTLATVDKDGYPHNRTLVYRGFLFDNQSNNVLTFCTDKRMKKYDELRNNDKIEAVFYFEKIKKQFRFRGRARLIDENHYPELDLAKIQPKHLIETSMNSLDNSSDEESDHELHMTVTPKREAERKDIEQVKTGKEEGAGATGKQTEKCLCNEPSSPQSSPLAYPIVSPTLLQKLQSENSHNISYSNLAELSNLELVPPTKEEWDGEIERVWLLLSKGLKSSYRRPAPLLPMDDENQNMIDKISRGVDGKKEESGKKNFAVVGMFIDHVDYYELEKDRRYLYDKDDTYVWSEMEVCP